MTAARRPALIAGVVAALLIAGVLAFIALSDRDDSAARHAAERYLEVLSDDDSDPGDLDDLVSIGDPSALERADELLAASLERISNVTLGESREATTARTTSDVVFDRFEQFDVGYRLAGERHRAKITLGLPRTGADDEWLVVTPLTGSVDWNSAAWGNALLDVTVGGVEVTETGRTAYEPDAQFLHPGVYPLRAGVGRYFTSAETDFVVAAGAQTRPLPTFDIAPTPVGTTAITRQVRAAFQPCSRGTTYCPVLDLVEPRDDDLPEGWWRGLTTAPTITVDGTAVTLRGGEFRYLSPAGLRTVAFDGNATVTIDATTRRPGVAVPLTLTRR